MKDIEFKINKSTQTLESIAINKANILLDGSMKIIVPSKIDDCELKTIGSKTYYFLQFSEDVKIKINYKDLKFIKIIFKEGFEKIITISTRVSVPMLIEVPSTITEMECNFEHTIFKAFRFKNNSKLEKMSSCFRHCIFEEEFLFPDSLKVIEDSSFYNCCFKNGFSFSKNSKLIEIEAFAFSGVEGNMKTLTLPKTLETIGYEAFAQVKNIEELIYSCSSYFEIKSAFTKSDFQRVVLKGNGILNGEIFSYCKNLKELDLEDIVLFDLEIKIPSKFCFNCSNLEKVKLPKKIRIIGENAFSYTSISEIKFNSRLITIENEAFLYSKLKEIIFEDSICVENIGSQAFAHTKLATIPENIFNNCKYIGEKAFSDTKIEKLVIFSPPNHCITGEGIFSYNTFLSTIELKNDLYDWKYLSDGIFSNNYYLTTIILPETIISMGKECFANSNFETFVAPKALKNIEARCFSNNTRLKEVDLSNSNISELTSEKIFHGVSYNSFKLPYFIGKVSYESFCNISEESLKELFKEYSFLNFV